MIQQSPVNLRPNTLERRKRKDPFLCQLDVTECFLYNNGSEFTSDL
uniref:Uncharacterized protein n=1 Tax=Tetranychus urticae TaxID=32264 RepID=T1KIK0_TETUR